MLPADDDWAARHMYASSSAPRLHGGGSRSQGTMVETVVRCLSLVTRATGATQVTMAVPAVAALLMRMAGRPRPQGQTRGAEWPVRGCERISSTPTWALPDCRGQLPEGRVPRRQAGCSGHIQRQRLCADCKKMKRREGGLSCSQGGCRPNQRHQRLYEDQ